MRTLHYVDGCYIWDYMDRCCLTCLWPVHQGPTKEQWEYQVKVCSLSTTLLSLSCSLVAKFHWPSRAEDRTLWAWPRTTYTLNRPTLRHTRRICSRNAPWKQNILFIITVWCHKISKVQKAYKCNDGKVKNFELKRTLNIKQHPEHRVTLSCCFCRMFRGKNCFFSLQLN